MIGFEKIKEQILISYHNNKLHHANLIQGKNGIGKASFIKELIAEILNKEIHPDLLIIEKEDGKKNITVDKIRKISNFMNQTSAISENKFIIINSACELNKSAANSLLKILEEPHANNFIFLVSHNLSKVMPTIRSRCQIIKIKDLSFENFSKILKKHKPQIQDNELRFLSQICDNSPANSINNGSELTNNYQEFLNSLNNRKIDVKFLKQISDKRFPFEIFEKNIEFFSNRLIKFINAVKIELFFNEEEVFLNLAKKLSKDQIFTILQDNLKSLKGINSLNIDKKLCIINIFNKINL